MGRKSDLGRFAAAHHGAPVTTARLLTFLAVGFVLGGGGGWIFMGTMHAVSGEQGCLPGGCWSSAGCCCGPPKCCAALWVLLHPRLFDTLRLPALTGCCA